MRTPFRRFFGRRIAVFRLLRIFAHKTNIYGRQHHFEPSRRPETEIRGDGTETHRPRSHRRRQAVRAAQQGVQGAGTDHRDLGTLPHGSGQPRRSQGHPRQRQGRGDARNGARGDHRAGTRHRADGGADQAAADPQGSAGLEERHHGDPRRHRRRRSGHFRRRPAAHVHQIHRIEGLALRNDLVLGRRRGRLQGGRAQGHGSERLRHAQIRVGRAPRTARAPDRNAGPRPHLGGIGGRAAKPRSSTSRFR